MQIPAALATWDWAPFTVGLRREKTCMQDLRVLTERCGKSRPVIGIRLDDSADEPRIAEVEPDGPAACSGIVAGYVIAKYGDFI